MSHVFPTVPPGVSPATLQALRQARLDAGSFFPRLFDPVSDPATWPRDEEIRQAWQSHQRLLDLQRQADEGLAKTRANPLALDGVWALTHPVDAQGDAIAALQRAQAEGDGLPAAARRTGLHALTDADAERVRLQADHVVALRDRLRHQLADLQLPTGAWNHPAFRDAVARGAAGDAPLGGLLQRWRADATLKAWLDEVRVDGRVVRETGGWQRVQEHLQVLDQASEASLAWAQQQQAWSLAHAPHEGPEGQTARDDLVADHGGTPASFSRSTALVVARTGLQTPADVLRHLQAVADQALAQLAQLTWTQQLAPAMERCMAAVFQDPTALGPATKSRWVRGQDAVAPIQLRRPVGQAKGVGTDSAQGRSSDPATDASHDGHYAARARAPWLGWAQRDEAYRERVLATAERSLNLWQAIEQETAFLAVFREQVGRLLREATVRARLPDLPAAPVTTRTRQTVVAATPTLMDRVRLFLEVELWDGLTTGSGTRVGGGADLGRPITSGLSRARGLTAGGLSSGGPASGGMLGSGFTGGGAGRTGPTPVDALLAHWRSLTTTGERLFTAVQLAAVPAAKGLTALAQAGLGDWAQALLKAPLDNLPNPKRVHAALPDDPLLPEDWQARLTLAQVHAFLGQVDGGGALAAVMAERHAVAAAWTRGLQTLVAEKAWAGLARTVTPRQRQALGAYLSAVRAIGSGTGKRSARHQQDARAAMMDALNAVPCWIMPTSRVSESMPSELGVFDLVIIDEASQSDISALPALMRGKKILVVGDDKQVSPSNFVQEEVIVQHRRTLLAHQPFAPLLAPDRSIYDLFSGVLPTASIMLREHFRCVAPIIQWSNDRYYHGKMVPLRLPPAAQRLDPALVDILVEDGAMVDDANPAEATVIAREILALTQDPAMAHKTIGVVTLPSKEAASLAIKAAIDQAVPHVAYLRHKILVGPPARFQGSERDIMFIAMTWDGQGGGASDRTEFHQRFNVALSRARDRMILVRSIPDSALRPGNLLTEVVHHFQPAYVDRSTPTSPDLPTPLPARDGSPLEQAVTHALQQHGYHVQAKVGPRYAQMDLVVEDAAGHRLAIECDGDHLTTGNDCIDHWKTHWAAALGRQRVLERVGWTVVRLTAAAWFMDPAAAGQRLLEALHGAGVRPGPIPGQDTLATLETRPPTIRGEGSGVTETVAPAAPPIAPKPPTGAPTRPQWRRHLNPDTAPKA